MAEESAARMPEGGAEAVASPDTMGTAEALQAVFGDAIQHVSTRLGQLAVTVDPKAIVDVCKFLRDERSFVMLSQT
jgi:NADH:ubiquinone oxidoreductase subunit C